MKREIKFRAWDGIRKEMFYPYCLEHINGILTAKRYVTDENADVLTVLMQFTGLHDKSGKEIYEGDIIRCNNTQIGEVLWEEHDACFNVNGYYDSSDDYPTMAFIEGQPFEVIGNIFENPELLK
jgi:uncharacterized phage protein (TIGR01671 family)